MKAALKSFALITFSVLMVSGFAWIYMRNKGLQKPVHQMPHPFFDSHQHKALVAHRGGSEELPENTWVAFDHAAKLGKDVVLWADVQNTKDGTLVLFHDKDVSRTTGAKGWLPYMSDAEVAELDPGYGFKDDQGNHPWRGKGLRVPTLREFLGKYPDHRVVLNFVDYSPRMDERVAQLVKELKAGDRILFQSDLEGLLKDLRTQSATWLFGTSQAQATQLMVLLSLGLETVAPLKADVFVTPSKRGQIETLGEKAVAELKRRKMHILVGPVDDPAMAREHLSHGVDGIITGRPAALLEALKTELVGSAR